MIAREFRIEITGDGPRHYVRLPFDPDEVWGAKGVHHVTGTIAGHMIRGALTSDDSGYLLSLGPAWRRDTSLKAGDVVMVELAPEGPQFADLDSDVAAALSAAPEARAFFEALATYYRNGYINWIDGAKRPATRARRIAETIDLLKNRKRQR